MLFFFAMGVPCFLRVQQGRGGATSGEGGAAAEERAHADRHMGKADDALSACAKWVPLPARADGRPSPVPPHLVPVMSYDSMDAAVADLGLLPPPATMPPVKAWDVIFIASASLGATRAATPTRRQQRHVQRAPTPDGFAAKERVGACGMGLGMRAHPRCMRARAATHVRCRYLHALCRSRMARLPL